MSNVEQQPRSLWRGRINAVIDGVYFSQRIDEDRIVARADDMVRQWTFPDPVDVYYEAIVDALDSTERIAEPSEDEDHARDFLRRIKQTLDARRPWPMAAYTELDASAWSDFRNLRPIAVIALKENTVGERLNRYFDELPDDGAVKILRLRSGDTIALHSADFRTPGVTIHAYTDDAGATIEAFRTLTGFAADEIDRA